MCSASMGAEGSVTLQLREAVQAPEPGSSLDTALTIGYPDPEILADVLGTLQAAGKSNSLVLWSYASNSIIIKVRKIQRCNVLQWLTQPCTFRKPLKDFALAGLFPTN